MKVLSILLVLALVTLPGGIRISFTVFQLLTKGSKPPSKFGRFRSQNKALSYLILSSWGLLIIVASSWMVYEVISPNFGLPVIGIIWSASSMVILLLVSIVFPLHLRNRILRKLPPRPAPDSPGNEVSDWQKRHDDEMSDNLLRNIGLTLLVLVAVMIIWIALSVLVFRHFS